MGRPSLVHGVSYALERAIGRSRPSLAELARLQGFPDAFPWFAAQTRDDRARAVCQATPPILAATVARRLVLLDLPPDTESQ